MTTYTFTGNNGDAPPAGLTTYEGAFEILNNRLVCSVLGSSGGSYIGQQTSADDRIETLVSKEGNAANRSGLFIRYSDANAHWRITINGTGLVELIERNGGSTTRATYQIASFDASASYLLAAECTGTSIKVFVDGAERISYTSSVHQSNTIHGIRAGNTTSSFDNLTYGTTSISADLVEFDFTNETTKTVNLTWSGTPAEIHYKIDGGDAVQGIASPTGGAGSIELPLTVGTHSVEFFFSDNPSITTTVNNVSRGVVVALAGQSNQTGQGVNNQTYTNSAGNSKAHMFGNDYSFKELTDPTDDNTGQVDLVSRDTIYGGSPIVRFAHYFINDGNVPVCIIPCAFNGSSMGEWQKTSTDRVGGKNLYESMADRINAVGGVDVVIQGSWGSDAGDGTTKTQYKALLHQFIDDVFADFGAPTLVQAGQLITGDPTKDGDGVTTGQIPIRAGQAEVANENPNAVITVPMTDIDLTDGDGKHFQQDDELDLVGIRLFDAYKTINATTTSDFNDGVKYAINRSLAMQAV